MSRDNSMPADMAVREAALDPTRSFIVEAPAGSGKTELLTRRFLRLLAGVKEPEEVLAITFTRKAAAEMRVRIVNALASAELPAPEKESQRAIWQLAKAVRDADLRHDWQLRAHSARLRIMTIDALNSFLARQLPILSGAGAPLRIAPDPQTLYSETVLRLIERLGSREADSEPIARLLRHLDNRYELFESLLSSELQRREHWLDLGLMRFELPHLRGQLEAALRAAVENELKGLHALLPREEHDELTSLAKHAAAVLNGMGIESPIASCDDLDGLPKAVCEALKHWQGIAELLLTKTGDWRATADKRIGFPSDNKPIKQRMMDLVQRLQRESNLGSALHRARALPNDKYTEAQWQVLTDLLDVLKLAVVQLEVVMRERGESDYTANAIAARRALGSIDEPTDLALRLDYKLQHVLVDEFQDTSRGQIELLSLLTAGWTEGDGRTLFCVGDPMQSIYRFRHADVGLFLNLKRNGLQQLRLTPLRLTVNFRSTKPVLDWVNGAFLNALPASDDPERGAVAFTASEPQSAAGTDGGVFVHAYQGARLDAREKEAREIADLIAQTCAKSPDARIAVLVSNRLHLQWTIRELRARGIAFNAVDIDPLAARPAIQDLIALTRAVVHLADRTAWLATLRAPWCGLSLADLQTLCGESMVGDSRASDTIWQILRDPVRVQGCSEDGRRRIARVLPILRQAVSMRGRIALRDCVERTWLTLGGPGTVESANALRDADAYFSRLEEIERNGDLEDVARLESSLHDLYALDADAADVKVELMTVHRAKGLEFDVVILPALDSGSRGESQVLLRTQGSSQIGDRALLLAPISARGSETDPIYAWLEKMDKERSRLEKGRLLYVAATRAERELHLFGAVDTGSKPRASTFLHALWPLVSTHFEQAITVTSDRESGVAEPGSIRTRRVPLDWRMPVPEANVGELNLRNVVEDELLHPEFAWVSETARHVGTLVHREIERLARAETVSIASLKECEARSRIGLAELGVPPHLRDRAAKRIADALIAMLNDERGQWLLAGADVHREAASELAISGLVGGEIANRVIDRTFVDREGIRWIVDFKTSTHEGGGLDEFLSSEVLRYESQLRLYAHLMRALHPIEPIKAALYFPLLRAWREVAV